MYRDQFGEFYTCIHWGLKGKGIIAYIQVVVAPKRVWGLQFYFKVQVDKILTAVSVSEE